MAQVTRPNGTTTIHEAWPVPQQEGHVTGPQQRHEAKRALRMPTLRGENVGVTWVAISRSISQSHLRSHLCVWTENLI